MENLFLETVLKAQENLAFTENGAVSYKTSGSTLADQFGKAGSAFGRDIDVVYAEQEALWKENPEMALKFPFYLRMITRKVKSNGATTQLLQKGPGVRDEAFKRLLWIEKNHPDAFYRNLWVLPLVGSYKDIWTLLLMSENPETEEYFKVLINGLQDPDSKDLVIKYMPRIRSNSKCLTNSAKKLNRLAKDFSKALGFKNYEAYRKFKTTGKAHVFQQLITKREFMKINWSEVPSKALTNLVYGNFLSNHNLEASYMDWLATHDEIKFNGTPVEIMSAYRGAISTRGKNPSAKKIARYTADSQFNSLINKVRSEGTWNKNVLCGLDTSGSMSWANLNSRGIQPLDVCLSLGIYFSELNTGAFHNHVAMFDDYSIMEVLEGTFSEKCDLLSRTNAMGGTNFESLIDLICHTRKNHPEIPLEDFPTTLLVVSDMQFNNCGEGTNLENAREKLAQVFPKEWADEFKFIWWNCVERGQKDVPATLEDKGSYMLSGYDGSIISLLTGLEQKAEKEQKERPTMEELINEALNQEVLLLIK